MGVRVSEGEWREGRRAHLSWAEILFALFELPMLVW